MCFSQMGKGKPLKCLLRTISKGSERTLDNAGPHKSNEVKNGYGEAPLTVNRTHGPQTKWGKKMVYKKPTHEDVQAALHTFLEDGGEIEHLPDETPPKEGAQFLEWADSFMVGVCR